MDKFSVIITTYNDEKKVDDFFSSVKLQTVQPDYIIVVDGGSKDNTISAIRRIADEMSVTEFIVIDNLGRLNISQGFNEGIRRCPTELLFLMGCGNSYPTNFCEEMLAEMQKSNSEIVQCNLKGINATPFAKVFNLAFVDNDEVAKSVNHGMLIKKEVFKKTGGFYENFIYAGEDTEFFWFRTKKFGIKMSYTDNTCVFWDTPENRKEYLKKSETYAIADIQLFPWSKLFAKTLFAFLSILFSLLFCCTVYPYILFLLLIFLLAFKIKTFNLKVILMRMSIMFLYPYFYVKNIKLFQKKYIIYTYQYPVI